jgi:GAF domain-containing protein
MAEHNSLGDQLAAVLDQVVQETGQMETILGRVMQVLTQNGFQISIDLVGVAHTIHAHVQTAQQQSQTVSQHLSQLEQLLDTFTLLTSKLDLDQVLEEVMDTVVALTGAERAYLLLVDARTGELTIAVARNWDRESILEGDVIFSRSIIDWVLHEQKPILTTNAQADQRFQNAKSVFNNQLRSIICIPLLLSGRAVGVLYADNRITQDVFRQEAIPLLAAFGTQAAVAIENARAYGQVKEELQQARSEIESLRIEIDQSKVQRQVSQITDSDFFQNLTTAAREMRQRASDSKAAPDAE